MGNTPAWRFIVVGVITFVLPFAVAIGLRETMVVHDQLAFLIASIVGITTNFALSYFFTWQLPWSPRAFIEACARFHFAKIWTIAIAQGLFAAVNALTNFYVAYVTVAITLAFVNYLLQRHWIFAKDGAMRGMPYR